MLHLESVIDSSGHRVIAAHGQINGAAVKHLRDEMRAQTTAQVPLILDLSGVDAMDREGADLLLRWGEDGLTLRGGSLFIRTLLRERGLRAQGG